MENWIKLYEKLIDWEWFDKPNTAHFFVYCLLKANKFDRQWRGITIKRGSFVSSLSKMSSESGLTVREIRTSLSRLKSTNELTSETTNEYTYITICNYDNYQATKNNNDKQIDKQATSNRQTNDKKATNERQQIENNKKIENNKNIEKKINPTCVCAREEVATDAGQAKEGQGDNENDIYGMLQQVFNAFYLSVKNTAYCPDWTWHTTKFSNIKDSVREKMTEEGLNWDKDNAGRWFGDFLKRAWDNCDDWGREHFDVAFVNSQFNTLYTSTKSAKSSTKKNPAPEGVTLGYDEWMRPDGTRTYGNGSVTVPLTAAPRPSSQFCWSSYSNSWIM